MVSADKDTVIRLDWGYTPEAAISAPVLFSTDAATYLTFNAMRLDHVRAGTAIVVFPRCVVLKFGYPNDEALPGHPLYDKMAGAYDIYEVLNSSWIAELEQHNRVAFPQTGKSVARHFIITFHDSTFECIADDLTLEIADEPYTQTFQRIGARLLAL